MPMRLRKGEALRGLVATQETNEYKVVPMSDSRFPRSGFAVGTDPDPRFTLSLVLLGVMRAVSVRVFLPLVLLAAGVLALVLAVWQRASRVDVALSSQAPLPHAIILASTACLVSLLAAFALWGLFL